jgi:alpha-amylase
LKQIHLALGVHNHQPVGNFDFIFEEAHDKAYLPFLELLERHPKVRIAQHYSGILLAWLEQHRPKFLARLRVLVERGQVEMMTGAFYEPILPVIPDEDKVGQIHKLTRFIQQHFSYQPSGMWLAERIWEPHLSKAVHDAGVRYVVLDDSHFKYAGLREQELLGHFVTEEQGATVSLFPISERLRYAIPYEEPEKTIEYLASLATEDGQRLVVFADDGEKFGVWPGSHQYCYEERWLERFFTALEENSDWIHLVHFSEALKRLPAAGRVYLPTASYREMMEWAMPPHAIVEYEAFEQFLSEAGTFERFKVFVRGGFWRNFLAKYPESNNMHKKMLHLSRRLSELRPAHADDPRFEQAQDHLWAGQCNCPYWHGVFGGLYLNHLRYANYHELLQAETLLDALERDSDGKKEGLADHHVFDFDADGHDEVLISTPVANFYFAPRLGGSLFELDYKPKAINLCDTMTRREEAYHHRLREAASPRQQSTTAANIHTDWISKEKGLEAFLQYDWYRRTSFLDHFLRPDTTLEAFAACKYGEQGDFVNQPFAYEVRRGRHHLGLDLWRDGIVWVGEYPASLRVSKSFRFSKERAELQASYRIKNLSSEPVELWFGVELDFALLAGDAPDRNYCFPGHHLANSRLNSKGVVDGVTTFSLRDDWLGLEIKIDLDGEAEVWRFPIETVSLSEAGFERVYQSSVVFPNWKFSLDADNEWERTISIFLNEV